MKINRLSIKNFRNHENTNIELTGGINIFYGNNAQGKTNILEDIIDEYIDDSNYYIVFDELDEDYREFENQEEL